MRRLTHIGRDGRAQMVDVSAKSMSKRRAVAAGKIRLRRETLDLIKNEAVAQTGVEMEALVGATVALLSIYDMCKAVDKEMQIYDVQLIEKTKSTVAVSLCEPHRPHVRASQRRVAHKATATTNDSRIKRKS